MTETAALKAIRKSDPMGGQPAVFICILQLNRVVHKATHSGYLSTGV